MYSKLTIKIVERCHWGRSDVFIGNFEHFSHLVLVFLLLTCNCRMESRYIFHEKSIIDV